MRRLAKNETFESMRQDEHTTSTFITAAHLTGLPEPMQRYLRYTGVIGKERIHTVHLEQKGMYRQRPEQKWLPMVAKQDYTINPPSFLWHMTSRPLPLVSISVTGQFSDGHGNLRVKLWPFISLGNARGPEIDQGELQRYLLETAQRYLQEKGTYRLEPWSGQFNEYQEVNGMQIPTKFEITWHLTSGDFNWLRGEITRIEYN